VIVFVAVVFPVVPQWLGGGLPQRVELALFDPVAAEERALVGDRAGSRCNYEVHVDAQTVYVMSFAASPTGCTAVRAGVRGWIISFLGLGAGIEYASIPRSRIRMTRYL
jgi:hypothetical protein